MANLLLVNKEDKVIGFETKEKCHQGKGILHRAFSIYIFNKKGQLLIQKRSKSKKLWPLCWANSCCSHPRKAEPYEKAGERRLKEELGFTHPLRLVDKFQYQARYKDVGSENELCAILIGEYDGRIKPDPKEVADWKWIGIERLKEDIKKNPDKYTPWLKTGFKRYLKIREKELKSEKELNSVLKEATGLVNPVMRELLDSYIDKRFHKLVNYQVSTGGKRLRPALTIISCRLFGGKIKDVLYPAAGLEILHNCTLIVDDIIDHSNLRRKKPTTWFKFGKSIAGCVGIDYSVAVFEAAGYSKRPIEISKIFAKTMKTIIEGEILDILFEQRGREEEPYIVENRYQRVTDKEYYKMVGKKTTFLFQSCCEAGGICAGASKKQLEALRGYGSNLGMAFQIQDDVLDIFGEEEKFGKKIGKDIEERKLGNIVMLFALRGLPGSERAEILKIIRKKEIKNKDIQEVIKLIKKTDSRQEAYHLGESFVEKAKESLTCLPQNKWKRTLEELANFVIRRQN